MSYDQTSDVNENDKPFSLPDPGQQHKNHEGEKDPDEEGTLLKQEEEKGMDMGTTFKEDTEQDLDDLIHNQGSLNKTSFPGPDEV